MDHLKKKSIPQNLTSYKSEYAAQISPVSDILNPSSQLAANSKLR